MAEAAAPRPLRRLFVLQFTRVSGIWITITGLFALALCARVILLLENPFDGLYGQDAYAYFDYARQVYEALTHFNPPPPFWWPLGYPALLGLGFLVFGTGIRSAQTITMLSGAMIAPLTFLLAREALPGRRGNVAGFLAGAIVALSGQLVQSSLVIMSDAPALMWATLSAWLLMRYRRSNQPAALMSSAIALALALVTRWENLGFAAVWLAALFLPDRLGSGERILGQVLRHLKEQRKAILGALGLAALVLLPQIIYKVAYAAPLAGQSWLEGWSPANIVARSFNTPDGHFDYELPVAVFYAQVFFHPAYLFPLLSPALAVGIWQLARMIRTETTASFLILGWVGMMYVFLAGIPYENFRFDLGLFVPVALAAGYGVASTWDILNKLRPGFGRIQTLRVVLVAIIAFSVVGEVAWESRAFDPVLHEKHLELTAAQWLSSRLPSGATVYSFSLTEALDHYSAFDVRDLSEETPERLAADAQSHGQAFLFVDQANIDTQWHATPLQQNLDVLRQKVGLTKRDKLEAYTLFEIGVPR